jgi:hypothetical protein
MIKWVNLGDKNTKLFHATATIKHRKKHISSLVNESGEIILDHYQKS